MRDYDSLVIIKKPPNPKKMKNESITCIECEKKKEERRFETRDE
jgi:hypothetical protein